MTAISLKSGGEDQKQPVHVAIIMDGNGRWAKARGLPRVAGHKEGAKAVKAVVRAAAKMGVSYLTLYGFSSENWKRPKSEVSDLMGLLRFYLKREVAELHKVGVRFTVIGNRKRLDKDIVKLIEESEALTAKNTGLNLVLALSYGGRDEIVEASRDLAEKVKAGELDPADIDADLFAKSLFTQDRPDPDLLIRTSGEKRISNFLLWQCAYTEFLFTDTPWPDFDEQAFEEAINNFTTRERRYGAISG